MKHTERTFRTIGAATLALAAVAVLAIGSHAALAGGGPGHHSANQAEHLAHIAAALGLSDQQKAAARKVHEQAAAKAAPLREQARLQHEEIAAMLDAGGADTSQLGQRVVEMHATHKKLEALHEQMLASVRTQLSAAQRAKLDKLLKSHGGPHGPGPHGPCSALSFGD